MEKYTSLKQIKKFLVPFIVLLTTNVTFGQYSSEYTSLKQTYPNADQVKLEEETTIEIELKDGEIYITQHFIKEDIYLNESATMRSKRSVNFSSFFELKEIEAATYTYIKGKYKEFEVKEFKEKDELDDSFHDDTKSLNFIYPNLKEGSKTHLKYTENVKIHAF